MENVYLLEGFTCFCFAGSMTSTAKKKKKRKKKERKRKRKTTSHHINVEPKANLACPKNGMKN